MSKMNWEEESLTGKQTESEGEGTITAIQIEYVVESKELPRGPLDHGIKKKILELAIQFSSLM